MPQKPPSPIVDKHLKSLKEKGITEYDIWVEVQVAEYLEQYEIRWRDGIKTALKYPAGSMAQYMCLKELEQDIELYEKENGL